MLIITDAPIGLVKYHVITNNEDNRIIKCLHSSSVAETTAAMLEGVDYDANGDLVPVTYIIEHDHTKIIDNNFKQDLNNRTYLVVEDVKKFHHLNGNRVKYLTLPPSQYQYILNGIQSIMEPEAWPYFWSEYCIGKFKSNPVKWYNESRYLLFLYKNRGEVKLNCNDLDFLYHKVSNTAKDYLRTMYTQEGKSNILKMTNNELFITFIRGHKIKSPVQKNIEQYKPSLLLCYMIMKEAFYAGTIRLKEAAIIFDYLLNKQEQKTVSQIRNLFNLT